MLVSEIQWTRAVDKSDGLDESEFRHILVRTQGVICAVNYLKCGIYAPLCRLFDLDRPYMHDDMIALCINTIWALAHSKSNPLPRPVETYLSR